MVNYIIDQVISWLIFLFGVGAPFYLILSAIGITGFKEITRYESYHGFYYRMNPVVKILLSVGVMLISALMIWWVGAILTVLILGTYLTLKNGRKKIFLGSLLVLSTLIGSTWGYAPLTPDSILSIALHTTSFTTVWTWPSYFAIMGYQPNLTLQGIIYGLQVSFRFTAILSASLLLIMTNTPAQILKALSKVGIPDVIIFSLMVAMKSVPKIFESLDIAIKVQLMRGLGSRVPKFLTPFAMIVAGIHAIVPTIVYLMRGAKDIAISADTRAFRAYERRTYLVDIPFTRVDYYLSAIIVTGIVIAAILMMFGFGRGIPYIS